MRRHLSRSVKVALVIACGLLGLSLTACSSPAGSGSASSSGSQSVTVWGPWTGADQAAVQQLVDEYNSSQSKYQVVYQYVDQVQQKLLTNEAAKSGIPDAIMWDRYSTSLYASKGVLQPLDDLIAQDKVDKSVFYQEALQELTYQDKTYGLPLTVDTRVIFYNKTLFTQAGLTPPTTWDQLEQAAIALTQRDASGKLTQSGFALEDAGLFNVWCLQAGCQLVNSDQTATAFNSPQGLSVLDFWGKLLFTDKVYDLGWASGSDPFAAGTLAMMYDGPWDIGKYNAVSGLDWGAVPPPTGPTGDQGAIMGGFGMVIPTGAPNTAGGWDFTKWWTTNTAQGVKFAQLDGWLPGNQKAMDDPFFQSDTYKPFVQALEYAKIRPTVAGYSDVENLVLTPQIQKFMSGEQDAATTLSTAQSQGDSILELG